MEQVDFIIQNKDELLQSYMSFIKAKGLFISTKQAHQLGETVRINLTLAEIPQTLNFKGKVIFINPQGAQNHAVAGIGIQFLEPEAADIRKKLEAYTCCAC